MAVAGLLITGFSLYLPITELRKRDDRADQFLSELAVFDAEVKQMSDALSRMDTLRPMSKEDQDRLNQSDAEVARRLAVIPIKRDALLRNSAYVRRLGILLVFGTALGIGCSVAGFILWYKRIQRHLDRVMASGDGEAS